MYVSPPYTKSAIPVKSTAWIYAFWQIEITLLIVKSTVAEDWDTQVICVHCNAHGAQNCG